MELHKIGGNLDVADSGSMSDILSESSETNTTTSDESLGTLRFRFNVKSVSGLPQSLAHFVFCQFTFHDELVVVPSLPRQTARNLGSTEFIFDFQKVITLNVTESVQNMCKTSAISVQVFGQKSKGFFSIREALRDRRRAQTVAERYSIAHPDLCWVCFNLNLKCEHRNTRWSELVRSIQLWIEIQEMNEHGKYVAVEVLSKDENDTGGIVQLKHGHQRKISVKVKTVPDTGNLPLTLHSISSVGVGSIIGRSKLQKPLNSYQDDGITMLRENWAMRVESIRDRLDKVIHKLADKENKSKDDEDLEKSLIDKKNCIIDELNKVLVVPETNQMQPTFHSGMESQVPLIFLDSNEENSVENLTEIDEHLPIAGENFFLSKENPEDYIYLPITNVLENEVGVTASWDSSLHENSKLNRVTPSHETLYMIIKVLVRLTDPAPIDLVLRKRICVNVYKRPSISNFFKKNISSYLGRSSISTTGVTFEVVNQVPDIYSESEWFEQIEAKIDDGDDTMKETFLENYSRSVSAVETLLAMEKYKQSEVLSELVLRQEELQQMLQNPAMRKSSSVMNVRNISGSSLGLNGFGSTRNLSTSQTSLDISMLRKHNRLSLTSTDQSNITKREQKRRSAPSQNRIGVSTKSKMISGSTIAEED